jgi:hypothetical protein
MKKLFVILSLISTLSFLPSSASALSGSDFNPGRIIDDLVFFNKNSMSVSQIQDFLNSKVPTCDTNHAGFTGGTGTIYSSPFICLKDFYENPDAPYTVNFTYKNTSGVDTTGSRTYYENNSYRYTSLTPVYTNGDYTQGYSLKGTMTNIAGVKPAGAISAAQIIHNAAQTYNINPQVLLVTLQKEQGLITDTWPASWQYQAAMGYGCPDTAPCSAGYAGFSKQVFSAAYQFRRYTDNPDSYNFKGGTTRYVQYNPSASCGGTNVAIVNQATANLYNYTPYQPNAAALANMSDSSAGGSASCGAYGNRNFFWYFNRWFGSTVRNLVSNSGGIYSIENGTKRPFPSELIFKSYGYQFSSVTAVSNTELSQIPLGDPVTYNALYREGRVIASKNSGVFLINGGIKRPFPSYISLISNGYSYGDVLTVSSYELGLMGEGLPVDYNLGYRNTKLITSGGGIYYVSNSTKKAIPNVIIFNSNQYKWTDVFTISQQEMNLIPEDSAIIYNSHYRDNTLISYGGGIYLVENGLKRAVPSVQIFNSYSYKWASVSPISVQEFGYLADGTVLSLKI